MWCDPAHDLGNRNGRLWGTAYHDHALPDGQPLRRLLKDWCCGLKQLLPGIGRRRTHRRPDCGLGGAAGTCWRVGSNSGVAKVKHDLSKWDAELLGGDLGERSACACPNVLGAGDYIGAPIGVELDPGVAGRLAATATPVVGSKPKSAPL